jgi:hypothetical protein
MVVHKNQCTKSRIIPLCWFALLPPFGIILHLNHLCWHLITKILEMAQGHIFLSISPFWWFMPTQHKATHRSAISMQIRTRIVFDSNLAYLDHSLPPLGLFLQIKLNFLSLSQTLLLRHKERHSKRNWSTIRKLPLFPIIKHSPHKRPTFDKRDTLEYFDKTKVLTLLFSKFSGGSWSICFSLNFSHFGIKHQNGIIFGPINLIASPKLSTKSKRQ